MADCRHIENRYFATITTMCIFHASSTSKIGRPNNRPSRPIPTKKALLEGVYFHFPIFSIYLIFIFFLYLFSIFIFPYFRFILYLSIFYLFSLANFDFLFLFLFSSFRISNSSVLFCFRNRKRY